MVVEFIMSEFVSEDPLDAVVELMDSLSTEFPKATIENKDRTFQLRRKCLDVVVSGLRLATVEEIM